jgi:hypothetical protein
MTDEQIEAIAEVIIAARELMDDALDPVERHVH